MLCLTQIFWLSREYKRRFLSIFEHEHHRALDILTSSGANITIYFLKVLMFSEYFRVSDSDSNFEHARAHKKWQFRTSSEHKHTLFLAGTSEHQVVRSSTQHYLKIWILNNNAVEVGLTVIFITFYSIRAVILLCKYYL